MSQVLFRLMGRGLFPWGGGGGWAWDLAGRFGQSANHNPSTKIHSCILTDSILSKPRRRSLCRTSAKLRELSSRLGTMQMSHQSRGGLSLGTLPAWVPSLPPLLSPSDLIISCPHWLWSLCSLLPECVQLNTGSRGRCWPWLEGSSRSRGCQPPKPTASH